MRLNDYLHNTALEINAEIESFFTKWFKNIEHISPSLLPYAKALAGSCEGGKRIRGSLVILAYQLSLNPNSIHLSTQPLNKDILKIAAAYEIFQSSILAHDDIIDKSLLRRGRPSLYSVLGADHAGISKAICLGDIGFFIAFNLISESEFPDALKNKAISIFSKTMLDTGLGELLDVELSGKQVRKSEIQDILNIYKFKTAQYTFTGPLLLGAILAGKKDEDLESLINYGQNIGIAFQIQDDINDIFSEKEQLGKAPGGDIKEGKATLLYAYALKHSDPAQSKILNKFYASQEIREKETRLIREIFIKSGALDYARTQAGKFAALGKSYIPAITGDSVFNPMFNELTDNFLKNIKS